jgi:hypothetical protein
MEDHHLGGQGWNSAAEPEEEEEILIVNLMKIVLHLVAQAKTRRS